MHEAEQFTGRNSLICPCCLQIVEDVAFLADPSSCRITNGEKTAQLTQKQFKLASYLINTFPGIAKKDGIYDAVLMRENGDGPDIKIIDVMICQIRPLLAEVGLVIETVWGVGYRLIETSKEHAAGIKDAGIRLREKGSANRWKPEYDATLLDLMLRKNSATRCANIMRLPYMTVERAYKRLLSQMLEA